MGSRFRPPTLPRRPQALPGIRAPGVPAPAYTGRRPEKQKKYFSRSKTNNSNNRHNVIDLNKWKQLIDLPAEHLNPRRGRKKAEVICREADTERWLQRRQRPLVGGFTGQEKENLRTWFFDQMDMNGNGTISVDELKSPLLSLGIAHDMKGADDIIRKSLQARATEITFEEFLTICQDANAEAAGSSAQHPKGRGIGRSKSKGKKFKKTNKSTRHEHLLTKLQCMQKGSPLALDCQLSAERRKQVLQCILPPCVRAAAADSHHRQRNMRNNRSSVAVRKSGRLRRDTHARHPRGHRSEFSETVFDAIAKRASVVTRASAAKVVNVDPAVNQTQNGPREHTHFVQSLEDHKYLQCIQSVIARARAQIDSDSAAAAALATGPPGGLSGKHGNKKQEHWGKVRDNMRNSSNAQGEQGQSGLTFNATRFRRPETAALKRLNEEVSQSLKPKRVENVGALLKKNKFVGYGWSTKPQL